MAVYVDELFAWPIASIEDPQARRTAARNGGLWCHMWADTEEELHAMAVAIGLRLAWVQKAGTPDVHYDLVVSKRNAAIVQGAIPSTTRAWVRRK